jgi:hypothetical protein
MNSTEAVSARDSHCPVDEPDRGAADRHLSARRFGRVVDRIGDHFHMLMWAQYATSALPFASNRSPWPEERHPGGELPAPGALRRAGTDSGHQPHATGSMPDIVEHDAVQVRQQPGDKITWPVIIQPESLHDRVTRRALIMQSAPEPPQLGR